MRSSVTRMVLIASVVLGVGIISAGPASAHQHRHVKGFDTTVGWLNEPAYAGFQNGVQFIIERPRPGAGEEAGQDEGGRPVEGAKLQVEVLFGDESATQKTEALELRPAFGAPGEYHAALIPTDPGTYTFHIFGTIGKVEFDEFYTSGETGANDRSEGTYNDIQQPEDISFPGRAPTSTDLNEQVAAAVAATDNVDGTAKMAMFIGIGGAVLGLLAIVLGMPKRKGAA